MNYSAAKVIRRSLDDLKRRRPRQPQYRVWSLTTITLMSIGVIALAAAIIYMFGHRSFLVETTRVLAAVSATLFVFLTISLYHGVRIRKNDFPTARDIPHIAVGEFGHFAGDGGGFDSIISLDADDPISLIVGFIVWIFVLLLFMLLLPFLLWIFVNTGLAIAFFLFFALAWVFSRALRTVFRKSRVSKHNLPVSLGYAAMYTFLYTGWLFALTRFAIYLSPGAAG